MHRITRVKLVDINPHLTCVLCGGYYIDATTVIECLHSFCKTCIVGFLETNKSCPTCDVQVHKTRPLSSIRSDQTLQDIVYKLVPGLFKNEMKRRREYYAKLPHAGSDQALPLSSEGRGEVCRVERLIFTAEDIISLSMEYCPPGVTFPPRPKVAQSEPTQANHRRYLRCPGASTVGHLKKLIRAKYGLSVRHKVDIMYMHDNLCDDYTMMDLAYIYSWRRNGPLRLYYKFPARHRKLRTEQNPTVNGLVPGATENGSVARLVANGPFLADRSAPAELDACSGQHQMHVPVPLLSSRPEGRPGLPPPEDRSISKDAFSLGPKQTPNALLPERNRSSEVT